MNFRYHEMQILQEMLVEYEKHCSTMQQRWRKSVDYHSIFKGWEEKKDVARAMVKRVLLGDPPEMGGDGNPIPLSGLLGDDRDTIIPPD